MIKPKVVGITGGISSGKSTVGRMLASLGAHYLNADEMCHKRMLVKEVKDKIVEELGAEVLDVNGHVDRSRLAKIVFQDKVRLDALCAILHPPVIEQIQTKIAEVEKLGRRKVVVIDAALLEESGLAIFCDFVIFVNTGKEHRVERSQLTRHWPADELEKREKFQMGLEEKKRSADYIIDNNFNEENTFRQVREFWQHCLEERQS